jgi:hypothetical protein
MPPETGGDQTRICCITGDMMEAVILNQMIYWSERVKDFDDFIREEQKRQLRENDHVSEFPLLCGWIHKSAGELKEEIMSNDSPKTILRKFDNLVSKGFLDRRSNPNSRYDHVYQYRVNFVTIVAALGLEGYTLDGYRVEFHSLHDCNGTESVEQQPKSSSEETKGQSDQSRGQNDHTESQIDLSEGHSVPTIPETTTEITIETMSSPSYSPRLGRRDGKTEDATAGEVNSFFEVVGIERLKRHELVAPMKAIISDLWRSRRVGKATVSRETVKKAISCLSPETIEEIFDKFDWQAKKGQIVAPAEYIKTLILNAPQDAALTSLMSHESEASYDIDEYVRLSLRRLNGG